MFCGHRSRALIAATLVAGTTAQIRAAVDPIRVLVRIENYAGIPPRTLTAAKAEVEEIFRSAEVSVTWEQAGEDRGRCVTLHLVHLETAAGNPRTSMLGLAVRPRQSAFVFYNRVLEVSRGRAIDEGVLLGRVMAHEMGHLLLPPGTHNHYGVMRGDIDVNVSNPNRFTPAEADRIRQTLTPPGDVAVPRAAPPVDRPRPRV